MTPLGLFFVARVRTRNLANFQRGNSKTAAAIRVRQARKQHEDGANETRAAMYRAKLTAIDLVPCVVTLRRLSSHWRGLDTHDGLPGSLKYVVDGIAEALGIDDGGPMVTWRYENKKCARGMFGVEVEVVRRT